MNSNGAGADGGPVHGGALKEGDPDLYEASSPMGGHPTHGWNGSITAKYFSAPGIG